MTDSKNAAKNYNTEYTQIRAQSSAAFQFTQLNIEEVGIPTTEETERTEENEKKFQDYLQQQEKINDPREKLLRGFSEEERQYMIVDLNNNCVYDARNDDDINKLTKSNSIKSPTVFKNNKPTWQEFWKNVKKCNIELLDAAEIGNLDKMKFLLDKSQNQYPVDLNYPLARLGCLNCYPYTNKAAWTINNKLTILRYNEVKSLDNYTALHFAVVDNHNEIVNILIENGCNIEAETTFKRTPLHICCIIGNIKALEILLKYKVNLNPLDNSQNTPLLLATEKKYSEIVDMLLQHGADPTIKNLQGVNAISGCPSKEIYEVLKKYNYHQTAEGFLLGDKFFNQSHQHHVEKILHNVDKLKKPLDEESKQGDEDENQENSDQRISSPDKVRNLINKEGSGAFGKVILVKDKKNQKYYAMKIISKERFLQLNLMKYAHSEKNAMNKMQHPFIVKLHHAFQTKRKLFLIQQYCGGGSLGRMLKIKNHFDEQTAKKYMCQIILAIEALHDNLIIFRDLKPDNIVLDDDGNAYLVDFGLAKIGVYDEINRSFLGTPAYLPPEIIVKDGHTRMADWYAVGIVLYELLMGCTPFNQGNVSRDVLYERIKQNSIKIPQNISNECQDIIQKLLCKNPKKRIGYKDDGREIRKHSWFDGVDWEKVIQKKVAMPKPVIRTIPSEALDVKFNEECDKEIDVANWTEINND